MKSVMRKIIAWVIVIFVIVVCIVVFYLLAAFTASVVISSIIMGICIVVIFGIGVLFNLAVKGVTQWLEERAEERRRYKSK